MGNSRIDWVGFRERERNGEVLFRMVVPPEFGLSDLGFGNYSASLSPAEQVMIPDGTSLRITRNGEEIIVGRLVDK